MKRQVYAVGLALWLACIVAAPARGGEGGGGREARAALPPNLIIARDARGYVEAIWRRSPTFRRQCRRIAREPLLSVKLSFAARMWNINGARALSTVRRHAYGMTLIRITIFVSRDYVELIGHEFEHVLEQIEAVDLKALAARGGEVYRAEDGSFETRRAIAAGRRVRDEYAGAVTAGFTEEE